MAGEKEQIRQRVWRELREVAYPDSRFHFDFTSFVPDFQCSERAIARLLAANHYQGTASVSITPDNCLQGLRLKALEDGKKVLVSTHAIRRGFWLLEPEAIPKEQYSFASTLDGMEYVGRSIQMSEMKLEMLKIDLCVTGSSVVNAQGIRFGKGHGYFDLEWAMLRTIGAVSEHTPVATIVHDCQVVEDELYSDDTDVPCDFIYTPFQELAPSSVQKPLGGISWQKVNPSVMECIPPLQGLQAMVKSGMLNQP